MNNEKDYEDRLAETLTTYFISSLVSINDISNKDRKHILLGLKKIRSDSVRHSVLFNQLIQMVMENGEDNY